jgi:phosphoribosyl 1,2-cyclic phosphodiesterase
MRVTFHGVRGSIPTPGPLTQRYGGNTVCVEVRTADGTLIILDAGTGLRGLGNKLLAEKFDGVINMLITHPHWDHILGFPFFAPIDLKETRMCIHPQDASARERAKEGILFDGVHFPVRRENLAATTAVAPIMPAVAQIGSARVTRISLNHPGGSCGFRLDDADGTSLAYLTDNELAPPGELTTTPDELARFADGVGMLIHDAQYMPGDMPAKHGWGHSIVPQVLDLGRAASARSLVLHHHDPDRDDDALDLIGVEANAWAKEHARGMQVVVAAEGSTLQVE